MVEYQDIGCRLAPKCLECPFPECFDGKPSKVRAYAKRQENRQIAGLIAANGWQVKEAALELGVSVRQTYRILARVKNG